MHSLLLVGWCHLAELSILFRGRRGFVLWVAFVPTFGCIGGFPLLASRCLLLIGLGASRPGLRSLIGLLAHLVRLLFVPVSLFALSLALPLLVSLRLLLFFLLLLGLLDALFQKAEVFLRLFVSRIQIERLMVLVAGIVVARQLLFDILGIISLHKKGVASVVICLLSKSRVTAYKGLGVGLKGFVISLQAIRRVPKVEVDRGRGRIAF